MISGLVRIEAGILLHLKLKCWKIMSISHLDGRENIPLHAEKGWIFY